MDDQEFLKKFGNIIKHFRDKKGISQEKLSLESELHRTYIGGIERGERNISILNLKVLLEHLDLSWAEFGSSIDSNSSLVKDDSVSYNKAKDYLHLIPNVGENEFQKIYAYMFENINTKELKSREAIKNSFMNAINLCPKENISDIWHHLIYRIYIELKQYTNPEQSWVRTSGEAFELFIQDTYSNLLLKDNIKIKALISRDEKNEVLKRLNLSDKIGSSKIDLIVEKKNMGIGKDHNNFGIVGIMHAKVSLAERVSDDVPASQILMKTGLKSLLITLDVKSFPPPNGDLINRGELGSVDRPTDKRKYIEDHGSFDGCFSYNSRTVPSPASTKSGKCIYTINKISNNDALAYYLRNEFK